VTEAVAVPAGGVRLLEMVAALALAVAEPDGGVYFSVMVGLVADALATAATELTVIVGVPTDTFGAVAEAFTTPSGGKNSSCASPGVPGPDALTTPAGGLTLVLTDGAVALAVVEPEGGR
jgi:hypothetical protein